MKPVKDNQYKDDDSTRTIISEKPDKTKRKVFHEKDLIDIIHVVDDPELGEVSFGDLTLAEGTELNELGRGETPLSMHDRALMMVLKMRQKAEPDLTLEDLKKLPLGTATKLIELLTRESGFLPKTPPKKPEETEKKSKNGSTEAVMPKPSD